MAGWGVLHQEAARGVDGVTWHAEAAPRQATVAAVVARLTQQRDRATLVRRRSLPQGNGPERPFGLPGLAAKRLQAAWASILQALEAQAVLGCRAGDRPARGAGEAGHDRPVARPDGRDGEGVEAAIHGCVDHRAHDGRLQLRRWRLDARALLGRIRQGRNAGRLATAGRVIHPGTGVPPGGVLSPGGAHGSWQEALDRWGETVGKPHGRGEAGRRRDADDLGGAWRFRRAAEGCSQALPRRGGQVTRAVAPEKPRLRRVRRLPPGMTRRCPVWGCACFWPEDRQGVPRVTRHTARQTWPRAWSRSTAGMPAQRQGSGHACCNGLKARVRGHARDAGSHGHSTALARVCEWAMTWACNGRKRRGGKRRRGRGPRCTPLLDAVPRARPRMTEGRQRRGCA